jgi:heme/copper-type cytochrome/quinol oxidase subunit 1
MTVLPYFAFAHRLIPREPGSRDNLGPFVNVVTWILLIAALVGIASDTYVFAFVC